LLLSNCTFAGGKIKYEFVKPFETLAVGAKKEEQVLAKNLPFEARNKNWLPGRNPLRNVLSFLEGPKSAKLGHLC
jgi:hypothetical protein